MLILTDVDGTLTRKDTMFLFLQHRFGYAGFILRFIPLLPVMLAYKVGFIRNDTAKRWLLSWYLRGSQQEELEKAGEAFVRDHGTLLFRPAALKAITGWNSEGYDIFMVSASLDIWMEPLARMVGCKVICTRAAYENGVFTGGFEGKNCNGEEKARRIREVVPLSNYHRIQVYGDTSGDLPMLSLGTERYWKPFE